MEEKWEDIKGYEGLYQISNLGKVKSLERENWNGSQYITQKERILKPFIDKYGYLRITLQKSGTRKKFFIHRLVLQNFVGTDSNREQVNHKDENKQNNCLDNLEWVTNKENIRYSQAKKVIQLSKECKVIKVWNCMSEAAEVLNINIHNISACCRKYGRTKSAGGYIWKYQGG